MTVTTTFSRVTYAGNGVTLNYVIPYQFLEQADIVCTVDGATQLLGTDYTIAGDNTEPGSVLTFVVAPADGADISIVRRTSPTQLTEYTPYGPYKAEQHEADFDKAALLNQENQNDLAALEARVQTPAASDVSYDNTTSGLAGNDVQEAIDELAANPVDRTAWGEYSAKAYGAVGDGLADDRAPIQAAIDAASAAGGGIVIIEEGVYRVSAALIYKSNVVIRGLGRGTTIVALASAADDHVFNTDATVKDASIESLTIDANRSGQDSSIRAHGIRSGDDMTRIIFRDLHVLNSSGFGIGLQGADPNTGLLEDILIDNCYIEASGSDGIDIKNRSDANVGVKINDVFIKGFSKQDQPGSSGIDVRGFTTLTNIFVDLEDAPSDCSAIRFRAGSFDNPSGLGGRESSLTNFWILGQSTALVQQIGIQVTQRNVGVNNGYIFNCYRGIRLGGLSTEGADSCVISNVRIRDSVDNAIRIETGNAQNIIANCWISNSGAYAIAVKGNNTTITGIFISDSQSQGQITIGAGVGGTVIVGCQLTGAGPEVTDAGTSTQWVKFAFYGNAAPSASNPSNFSADRYLPVRDGEGAVYYVPARTTPW